jgi:hypothetical protein
MRQIGVILLSLLIFGSAKAEVVTLEMLGYISGKTTAYQNVGTVRTGDTFRLLVSYDDAPYQTRQTTVNGSELYTLMDYNVSFNLAEWSGSLPTEIRAQNSALTGVMTGGSTMTEWYRPLTTLHHRDWTITSGIFTGNDDLRGFTLTLVTDYASNPGGENYGWWEVGSQGVLDQGFLLLTAINRVEPSAVPTPGTLALLCAALFAFGFQSRRGFGVVVRKNGISRGNA